MERRGATERERGEREKERGVDFFLVFFSSFSGKIESASGCRVQFQSRREREGATAGCVLSVFFVRGEEFVKVKKKWLIIIFSFRPSLPFVKHVKGFLVFFLLPPALPSKAQVRAPLFFSRSMKRMNQSAPIHGFKLSNRWYL